MTPDVQEKPLQSENSAQEGWILIVDDHPLFCDALELTLRSLIPNTQVRTADTLEAALRILEVNPVPRLVSLDLNLPDVSGVEGVAAIRRAASQTILLVVSSLSDGRVVTSVKSAGANGFVPKHAERNIFETALRTIEESGHYFPDETAAETSSDEDAAREVGRLTLLTPQQARILDLICEGKLNKQIAFDLSIAETTVKAHITAIMRKLGVQSRTQAVLVAQKARFSNILSRDLT